MDILFVKDLNGEIWQLPCKVIDTIKDKDTGKYVSTVDIFLKKAQLSIDSLYSCAYGQENELPIMTAFVYKSAVVNQPEGKLGTILWSDDLGGAPKDLYYEISGFHWKILEKTMPTIDVEKIIKSFEKNPRTMKGVMNFIPAPEKIDEQIPVITQPAESTAVVKHDTLEGLLARREELKKEAAMITFQINRIKAREKARKASALKLFYDLKKS